jgi:hypothetical protein
MPPLEREDYSDVNTIDAEDRPSTAMRIAGSPTPHRPAPEMFRGPVGEFVRLVEPHTEADPVALLVQALVVFGNLVGRTAHCVADGHDHYGNLFAVLVAPTSKGRKGSSMRHVSNFFAQVEPGWTPVSGLASGEGLIHHLRNDGGVADKRVLVLEPEFARVLAACDRQGATLSAIIRDAWDSGTFRVLTKNTPLEATDAHVSLVAHITADELRRSLRATESANGFANRFLWVSCVRSKVLPDGGQPDDDALTPVRRQVQRALVVARGRGAMPREEEAARLWHAVYPDLSEGRPGVAGRVTSRAEAQVVRLALLYALAEEADRIQVAHLEAALALWRYCDASARAVFGESLGHRTADDILAALRQRGAEGLTRWELNRDVLGRNTGAAAIQEALRLLLELRLITGERDASGAGRPVERFYAVPPY